MRILLVANGYPPDARGGVETYTQTIAQALQARGHVVEVFCRVSAPREPEYAVHRELVEGIAVRRVVNDLTDATRFEQHYRNPRIDGPFLQHLREFQPELVHFQNCLGLSATLLPAARGLGLPVFVMLWDFWYICPRATLFTAERTLCGGPRGPVDCVTCLGGVSLGPLSAWKRLPLYKWLIGRMPARVNIGLRSRLDRPASALAAQPLVLQRHRRQMQARTDYLLDLLGQADGCQAPSEFVKSVYVAHGLAADRVEVLPPGIDLPGLERVPPTSGAEPVVAYIGSLQYHKGVDVLVSAFRAAGSLGGELRIYGQGDPQGVYVGRLRGEAAGDDRIRWMGAFGREELANILAKLDLLVVPSRCHETYSLVAREALLAGVPVIATNLGALPDVIQDGVNGYLVPAGDVPALSRALERAKTHLPELKAGTRLERPAPSLAEHVNALENYYERLMRPAESTLAAGPSRPA